MSWIFGNLSGTKGNQVSTDLDLNNSQGIASGGSLDHKLKNQQNVTKNQQMQEDHKTKLESIKSYGELFGNGLKSLITDEECVRGFVYGATLVVSYRTAKYSIPIIRRSIQSRISKPSLVRETSRLNINDLLWHPIKTFKNIIIRREGDVLKDVVLDPSLEAELRNLSIKIAKRLNFTFENVLFQGPTGTGKTLVARNLITSTNIDYATLSGYNVSQLGSKGVTAIHNLFDWASTSRSGIILFIDKADTFLRRRNSSDMSKDLRVCLDAFLSRIETPSNSYMLILASDKPNELDPAVKKRMRNIFKFDLPGLNERERLVRLYFEKFILDSTKDEKNKLKVANFDRDKFYLKVAEMTDKYSASEIRNLVEDWQSTISLEGILTEDLMMKVLEETKRTKDEWTKLFSKF